MHLRRRSVGWSAVAGCVAMVAAQAVAAQATGAMYYNIPAQSLESALSQFAIQSKRQVIFDPGIVPALEAPELKGEYQPEVALQMLLKDSGLRVRITRGNTIVVTGDEKAALSRRLNLVQVDGENDNAFERSTSSAPERSGAVERAGETVIELEEIVVTGTHIRGVNSSASPTFSLTRQDFLESGATTVQEALRTLPQNYLIDPGTGLVAGSTLCTIMVADPLLANATNALHYTGASPRPGNSLFYVDVPAGLAALTVELTKDGGTSYWSAQDPTGRAMPFWPYGSEVVNPEPVDATSREQRFSYADPVPGVWQFRLHNIEPHSMEDLDSVEDWSRPMPFDLTIRGDAQDRECLSSSSTEVMLKPGLEPASFEVVVAPGAGSLQVQIEHAAPEAQVGLYIYKVPEGERIATTLNTDDTALVYYDASLQPSKRYTLAVPPPGRYRIYLDPIHAPAQGLKVAYRAGIEQTSERP